MRTRTPPAALISSVEPVIALPEVVTVPVDVSVTAEVPALIPLRFPTDPTAIPAEFTSAKPCEATRRSARKSGWWARSRTPRLAARSPRARRR